MTTNAAVMPGVIDAIEETADNVGRVAGKATGKLENATEAGAKEIVTTTDWILIKFSENREKIGGVVSVAYESAGSLIEAMPVSLSSEQVAGISLGIVAGVLMAELFGASGLATVVLVAGGAVVGGAMAEDTM